MGAADVLPVWQPESRAAGAVLHHDGVVARYRGRGAVRAGGPADLPARRGSGALGRAGGRSVGWAFRPRPRPPARLAAGLAASSRTAAPGSGVARNRRGN